MKNVVNILMFFVLCILASCDEIKQVPPPVIVNPTVETPLINTKIIYTQANNFVAFDTKDLLLKSQGFTSLKLEVLPRYGKISFSKTGLIMYKSDSAKAETSELLIYKTINTDPLKTKQDTLLIIVSPDLSKIPCNAGAIPDFYTVKVNTPTILNVLKNDRFCNSILDSTTLEIVEKPILGSASVQNNRVLYIPKTGLSADDVFLYRICTGGTTPKCMIAGVRIDVEGNVCKTFLMPDLLVINKTNTATQVIKVLDNDKLCDNYDKKSLKISAQPRYGKAIVNSNNEIEYTQTANKTAIDALEYSIADKDGKNPLRMIVEIYIKEVPVCKADAKNGEMEVSVNQAKEAEFEIPYSLYLTACVEVKDVNFESQPTFGTLRIEGKKILYKLKPSDGKEHNDQFKYIVNTANGETLKANFTVKIKK
ncbi:Ig-like domain-containing protein [Arcicella aurantiaca]|nr:Ig-like domain-containing protein [Arcicella aurantiaca]